MGSSRIGFNNDCLLEGQNRIRVGEFWRNVVSHETKKAEFAVKRHIM